MESHDEIQKILEKCFEGTVKLDINSFINLIENINSDIFIYVLILFYEHKPFSKKTLNEYKYYNTNEISSNSISPDSMETTLIATPSLRMKFSPSVSIGKTLPLKENHDKNIHSKYIMNKISSGKNSENKQISKRNTEVNNKKILNNPDNIKKVISQGKSTGKIIDEFNNDDSETYR